MAEGEEVLGGGSPAAEMNEAAMPEEEGAVIDHVPEGEANEASMESIDDASHGNVVAEIEEEGEGSIEQDDDGDEGAAAPEGTSEGKTEKSSQDLDMKSRRDSLIDQSSFGVIPGVASMRGAMFDSSSFAKPAQSMDDGPSHPASLAPNLESLEAPEMSRSISSRPATAGGEDGVQLAQTESVPRLKTPGTPNRVTSRPTTRGSARGAAADDQDGQAQTAQEVLTPGRRQLPVLMASNSSINLMSGVGGSEQREQDAPITLRQTVEIEINEAPPESSAEKYPSPSTGSMIRPSRRRSDARRKGLSFAPMDDKGLSVASVDLRSRSGSDMLSSFSRSGDEPLSEAAILAAAAAADRVRLRKEKHKREMHARLQRMTSSLADKKTRKDKDPDNSDDDEEYEIQPVDEKKQGKYENLLRPLEKQMRIRVPERRSQLLYSDTAFYPNGREKALTALDRQKEERRLELHRRKNLGEERIVGKHIMPRVGMKVMYSFEAVDNHGRPATEGLQGVISAVDDDMLMCSVMWPESEEKEDDDDDDPAASGDKEEYCCTGYNNMYFLKIVKKDKEYNMSQARQWALDAILSPRFVPQNHQIWEMSSRHRLIPVGYKEKIRNGKNVLNNIKVSVRQDIKEWDRERIREEENLAERKRVEKLTRLTKKTVKKQTKKEQELLRQAQFANEAVGNTSTIRKLKASARQQLRDQVVSGEAVHLEDAGNEEVEKLMQGIKFPKLASQTFDDGLPTWMLRPSQPL